MQKYQSRKWMTRLTLATSNTAAPAKKSFWPAICELGLNGSLHTRTRTSDMPKQSMWCVFLLVFGLSIGSIQSLGWWTRQASGQTQVTHSAEEARPAAAVKKQLTCEPKHWRSLIMHQ